MVLIVLKWKVLISLLFEDERGHLVSQMERVGQPPVESGVDLESRQPPSSVCWDFSQYLATPLLLLLWHCLLRFRSLTGITGIQNQLCNTNI